MLSKKKITKMLNPNFRQHILKPLGKENKINKLVVDKKIASYARYVTDSQIVHRAKQFENDKSAYYGFNPIYPLCAVLNDGTVDKRFFEFNTVNHFLKEKDGDSAVEVITCILVEWCNENKNIKNFDIDIIDTELAKIEKEYLEKQKKEKEVKEEKLSSEISCN